MFKLKEKTGCTNGLHAKKNTLEHGKKNRRERDIERGEVRGGGGEREGDIKIERDRDQWKSSVASRNRHHRSLSRAAVEVLKTGSFTISELIPLGLGAGLDMRPT
jgi:hypothetical protein